MLRRSFIKLLALLALSRHAAANSSTAGNSSTTRARQTKKILVIGAGLAGLACAKQLQQAGHQVLVLEGRDRIGGRIWTSTHWPDVPLDLGASWIHGQEDNPLTALAHELELELLATSTANSQIYQADGSVLTEAGQQQLDQLEQRFSALLAAAQDLPADQSISVALQSLYQQLDDPTAVQMLDFLLNARIEQEYAGALSETSAHWFDAAQEFGDTDVLFAQGFAALVQYLAAGLTVQLNQVVTAVQRSADQVRVNTTRQSFLADQVVITLPLGVLQQQRIEFDPPLPVAKQQAIAALGMGTLNKCYLRFPTAFWPAQLDWLEYIPTQHGQWAQWVSFQRVSGLPILLGFNAAEYGRQLETLSDEQIVAAAMQRLRQMFGDAIPAPLDYIITRWASDPFAFGSYSFNKIGATPQHRAALVSPVANQLYFAGEACSVDYFGTAHGAYLSGLAAAEAILQAD